MKRILVEYESMMPTVNMTVSQLAGFAELHSCELRVLPAKSVKNSDIRWSDVVFSIRGSSPLQYSIARAAKRAGRFLIYFLDDNLLEPPTNYVALPYRKTCIRKMIQISDMVLSSTTILAQRLCQESEMKRFATVSTIVGEMMPPDSSPHEKIRILYAGTAAHVASFDKYIKPLFPQMIKEFGSRISMTFIAIHPDLSAYEDAMEIHYMDAMPYPEYKAFMSKNRFDIGIAPLEKGGFTQYKYFNKFIEYTTNGMMGLYTDCVPYNMVVRDRVNGILCDNTEDAWMAGFRDAIDDGALRARCIQNAQRLLREEFTADSIYAKFAADIPELITFDAPKDRSVRGMPAAKFVYIFFRLWERMYLIFAYSASLGFANMIRKAASGVMQRRKNKYIKKI